MDKIRIPIYRGLTENDSRYYGLSLFWTQNDVPKVSAIKRVDCITQVKDTFMGVFWDWKVTKNWKKQIFESKLCSSPKGINLLQIVIPEWMDH